MWRFELGSHGCLARMARVAFLLFAATGVTSAQTFTTIVNLDRTTGAGAGGALIQGPDGNLYGVTGADGGHGAGTVFKVSPRGKLTTLYSFCAQTNCKDGASPRVGLVLGTDQNFYGVTTWGGDTIACQLGCGTVFKITPGGTLTTLHTFEGGDGEEPGPLAQGTDGNLYGTTLYGGINCDYYNDGCGTAFSITPAGVFTTLHTFTGPEGALPLGGLIQGPDTRFYGVTFAGGNGTSCADTCGTVFVMTPAGTITTLHSFDFTDGAYPQAALLLGGDGNFYGTTFGGGASTACSLGCGTAFKMTPAGTVTTLHSFDLSDGAGPSASLIQGTDGNFYGATFPGGTSTACPGNEGDGGCGTLFKMTPASTLTTLHNFDFTDGWGANGLFQSTSGAFYGMAYGGGINNDGTIDTLDLGLGPFLRTVPAYGKVGQRVLVLGNNLSGATSVAFNGTPAKFTVASSTLITALVPAGATTGPVQVTTPSGTLTSNVRFRVR
ncbi:MAG TPA: choice-of-anchor tandem repeat GloVer-containing protein [Terriglobia bacterium]|nr:choice-of-anchor tandem repeat GloVer-containing protein [Terriglobia bacterium]